MSIQLDDTSEVALARTMSAAKRLGLYENILELHIQGFTILKDVLSAEEVGRAREAILDRVEEKTGKRPDLDTTTDSSATTYVPYLLYDDPVFEDILMKERPLVLIYYLLGESAKLSSIGSHFKAPGEAGELALHADTDGGIPSPMPTHGLVANVNYALVPYSREGGATAVVPASHHWCRQPTPREKRLGGEHANPHAIAVDLSPGDCVVWHGNLWHGSFPRTIPGLRVNLAYYFARLSLLGQELHGDRVPQEALARHADDPRFARLLSRSQFFGWGKEGPNYEIAQQLPVGLFD
ncbi:MAG: phytanoyl-CoA dioxygenase family protein [Proteobacteria bacterium]|nr:phytanoyl-CoA dioxygenase family protein [Pseudomonadota bacterium]